MAPKEHDISGANGVIRRLLLSGPALLFDFDFVFVYWFCANSKGQKAGRLSLEPGLAFDALRRRHSVCLQPALPASVLFVLNRCSVHRGPGGGFGPVGYDLSFPFVDLSQSLKPR